MTTPTPSPEAEALPTLPVVAYQHRKLGKSKSWGPAVVADFIMEGFERRSLTPQAPAEAAIVALRDDRDSWCQQASARTEDAVRFAAERDALRAEVAELRKERDALNDARNATIDLANARHDALKAAQDDHARDARLLDWLDETAKDSCVEVGFEMDGGVYLRLDTPGDAGIDIREKNSARDALDAARASLLGDGGTL